MALLNIFPLMAVCSNPTRDFGILQVRKLSSKLMEHHSLVPIVMYLSAT